MKLNVDENGYVTAYTTRDMEGAQEYIGEIPEGFSPKTMPLYHLVNGVLTLDTDKQAAAQNREALTIELYELFDWYDKTDYMALKVLRGNWQPDDKRYLQYLIDYDAKHVRAEEIKQILDLAMQ